MIMAFELIEYIENYDKMLTEVEHVLHRDGIFFVSTPNRDICEIKNKNHGREFDYIELTNILDKHFKYLKIMHQMFQSALAIQSSSKSSDAEQMEISRTSKHNGVLENLLYLVAACSLAPPHIKECVHLFPVRNLLLENHRSLKKPQKEFAEGTGRALRLRGSQSQR